MKLNTRAIINRVSLAVGTLPALASNALAVDGALNGSLQPANTNDIVSNLGAFFGSGSIHPGVCNSHLCFWHGCLYYRDIST